jgi:hypothetical protein
VVAARRELHETFGIGLAEVGVVVAGSGVQAEGADGVTHDLGARGWDHFRVD